MRILLTNDDGIRAPGIAALYKAVAPMGEVHVVAPANVQSGVGHATTFHKPIVTRRHDSTVLDAKGKPLFTGTEVDGRPADCTKLALTHIVPKPVDLVISGMNAGANCGINVIYSGTVAAAMEAGFLGVPAIAVSLHMADMHTPDDALFAEAAKHARQVIDRILAAGPLEPHTVLNLNLPILAPGEQPAGVKVLPVSTSPLVNDYDEEIDGKSRVFNPSRGFRFKSTEPDTDVEALFNKFITITPLHYDLTAYEKIDAWRKQIGA